MAKIDSEARTVSVKIAYCGPPGSGKWTNLECIHRSTCAPGQPPASKHGSAGFSLRLGELRGHGIIITLLRWPSDGAWTREVSEGQGGLPDGFVFVADSGAEALLDNVASLHKLNAELAAQGLDLGKLPCVFQYNKRDLPRAQTVEQLRRALNPWDQPDGEAIATQRIGVFETVKQVAKSVLATLRG